MVARWPADLDAAREALYARRPYLGAILWAMRPVRGGVDTLGVDADLRLYYSPEWLLLTKQRDKPGLLYHECMHWLARHHARLGMFMAKRAAQGISRDAWLVATDCEINPPVLREGFPLPLPRCDPASLSLASGLTAEEYYDLLCRPQGGGGGRMGSLTIRICDSPAAGAGDGRDARERGEAAAGQGVGGLPKDVLDAIADAVADELASGKHAGTAPGHLKRWAAARKRSRYNWRRHLRHLLGTVHDDARGTFDTSYTRPSRRRVAGIVLPGGVAALAKVAIGLDTSGSMGDARRANSPLWRAVGQVTPIVRAVGREAELVAFDAAVQGRQRVRAGTAALSVGGGGGTSMTGCILACLESRPAAVVLLTDAICRWDIAPERVGRTRVIVGVVADSWGEAEANMRRVPAWLHPINLMEPSDA